MRKEAYNWLFGYNAGLTWNGAEGNNISATGLRGVIGSTTIYNMPRVYPANKTSPLSTTEGCFTYSDGEGNLLFASDGIRVWDGSLTRINSTKPLTGHDSSPQSGIILPHPTDENKFIAVTLGYGSANNLSYTVINVNNGIVTLDDVNINKLFSGHSGLLGESVTAIRKAKEKGYWVIAPGKGTNAYLNVWEITEDGTVQVNAPVTIKKLPESISASYSNGYIKFSPDGTYFAYGTWSANQLFFGKFDASTGTIVGDIKSRAKKLDNVGDGSTYYGVEFSPSGKYLYVSHATSSTATTVANGGVIRFEFDKLYDDPGIAADIVITKENLRENSKNNTSIGALQLGHDRRIYTTQLDQRHVFVIEEPDEENINVYKVSNYLKSGTFARWGLPSFSSSWFSLEIDGGNEYCQYATPSFTVEVSDGGFVNVKSIRWDFGDGSAIEEDLTAGKDEITRSHQYKTTGEYTITVKAYNLSGMEVSSLEKTFPVKIMPCGLSVNPHLRGHFRQ